MRLGNTDECFPGLPTTGQIGDWLVLGLRDDDRAGDKECQVNCFATGTAFELIMV